MNNDTIRVVTFREGDLYVAQALEVDVSAQGKTAEDAQRRLNVALRREEMDAEQEGRSLFDIGPAPHPFHVLYEAASISRTLAKVA